MLRDTNSVVYTFEVRILNIKCTVSYEAENNYF